MNFLKTFLASLLAFVVGSVVSSFIALLMFVGVLSFFMDGFKSESTYVAEPNTVLHINLSESIVEQEPSDLGDLIDFSNFSVSSVMTLKRVVGAIDAAAGDPNVKGIFLDMPVSYGISADAIYELRASLVRFKGAGKFVIGYADAYGQGAYWLSSVADKVYVSPNGGVDWRGMSAEVMFYKGLLDKLGVEAEIFRCGRYKSAVEPFMLTGMSAENREQMQGMVDGMWDVVVGEVSVSRKISDTLLRSYADSVFTAYEAMKVGMVDSLKYRSAVLDELAELSGGTVEDGPKMVGLRTYSTSVVPDYKGDEIAVLYASGEIVDTKSGKGQIVGDKLAAQLDLLRKDESVKAVVLRVNSPGGSALASDVICDAVERLKKVKPVVVSMGDYAASGGYYISCKADEIWASPTTLTGSIGVFGLMFNAEKGAKEHLGISTDIVSTNAAAAVSMFHPLTPFQRAQIQRSVDTVYNTFVSLVAQGRGMTYAQVDSIASGRVWTGTQALQNGLVDKLGTLQDAIQAAAIKCSATNYHVGTYPKGDNSPFTALFSSAMSSSLAWITNANTPEKLITRQLEALKARQGTLMLMPYKVVVE